jgi:gliding motility-associated-like protein
MAAVDGRHTIMTDIFEKDPNTCNGPEPNTELSLVPDGFNQSARIGDGQVGANAECIKYNMTIDTNNALLLLHFAVVFQDPNHSAAEQPNFEMRIQDTNGKLLTNVPCHSYKVVSGAGISGFNTCGSSSSAVHWRDWTTVGVSLLSLCGQKIQICFSSADCSQSGHYGYSYMVGECQPMSIDVQFCEGSNVARLTAPIGFTSYTWRDSRGQVVGTARKFNAQNPPDGTVYTCELMSAIGCSSKLEAVIQKTMIAPEFARSLDTCTHEVTLVQMAYATGSTVSSWTWEIGKEGYGTEYTSNDSIVKYVFQDTGLYTVLLTVNTKNGCADTQSYRVYNYPDPEAKIYCPETMCKYKETQVFATGGHDYYWSSLDSGRIVDYRHDTIIIDRGGTYAVRVTDTNGCHGYDTANTEHRAFRTQFAVSHEPCYDDAKGSITIRSTVGGTDPYFYTWTGYGSPDMSRGDANAVMKNLRAGKYYLFTIDDIGCVNYDTVEVTEPDSMTISLDRLVNMRCAKPNGSIEITVEGGSMPYAYLWDTPDADTTEDIWSLRDGTYEVLVTDAEGCTRRASYEVKAIPNPTIEVDTLVNETCDQSNGLIDVRTINGVEPLEYSWSPDGTGTKTDVLSGIPAGTYRVQVRDNLGCTYDTTLSIRNHATQVVTVKALEPEYCDRSDGLISVEVTGDTDYFEYSWLPSEVDENSPDLTGLRAGRYTVTVFDGTCTVSKEIEVSFVEGPVADFVTKTYNVATNNTFALSDNTTPGGGALSVWQWDLGDNSTESGKLVYHSYDSPGDYYVLMRVEDENRCWDTITKRIHVYDELSVYIPSAFTPNGDGLNDDWGPVMQEYQEEGYSLTLYDRWGQQVFRTEDTKERWDGRISGKPVTTNSVYSYKLVVKDFMGQFHEYVGHVTVVK